MAVVCKVKLPKNYHGVLSLLKFMEHKISQVYLSEVLRPIYMVFLDFLFNKFAERMLGPLEHICDFVKSIENGRKLVKWKSNQISIGPNFSPNSKQLFLVTEYVIHHGLKW